MSLPVSCMKRETQVMGLASVSVSFQRALSILPLQSQFGPSDRSRGALLQLGRGVKEMPFTIDHSRRSRFLFLRTFSIVILACSSPGGEVFGIHNTTCTIS